MARTSKAILRWLRVAVACTGLQTAIPQATSVPPNASSQRALLDKYCITCHNERLRTAGLTLDKANIDDIGGGAEVWEKVLRKVRTGAMPPAGMPRPDQATFDAFSSWLEASLDRAAAAKPNPGRVAIHRLNQAEYTHAIRDLLSLEIDGRSLLGIDEAGEDGGFDNMAAALSVSPSLVERYVAAARKISGLAVGAVKLDPVFETYSLPKMLMQEERMSEDLPFGSRGGVAIHHRFPVDGEYVVKIKLRGQAYEYILGLGRAHPIEVRLDGKRVKLLSIGGDAPGKPAPSSFAGNIPGSPEWEQWMHSADAALEARFPAQAGTRVVAVSFPEDVPEAEGVLQPAQSGGSGSAYNHLYEGYPAVETVSIGGPYKSAGAGETPSRRAIFVCRPKTAADEQPCARKILSTLARRAYRRPVTEDDLQPLLGFYETGRKQGSFDGGIQSALQRVLADPEFLFRIERDPPNATPGSVYRLTDLELASRLSFFLWNSVPDDQLLDLAAQGKLKDSAILKQQVQRMLADRRSKALADDFATQWLELPKLRGAAPDPDAFPDFDENLRQAFQQEAELFLESQIRENHGVVDLLRADYTFVNERLARHYGIPNVYGSHFRRVMLADENRKGLLGKGAILLVTSYADRTSPVLRGKWVLDNILASPPPPPPPNVPSLKENTAGAKLLTVRERMEEHRANAACAVCHVRMDPLGFALENFDAIGRWQTIRDGAPIDSMGSLPEGAKFQSVGGLRELLLTRRDQFAGAVTEKLLAWALGRSVEYYDNPALRKITREAASSDYRWSSIIEGIVTSTPFQMSVVRSGAAQRNVAGNTQTQIRRSDR
jgi:cytochrome c5